VLPSNWGDLGKLGERSAHPKLRGTPGDLGWAMKAGELKDADRDLKKEIPESSKVQEKHDVEGWALEIYKGANLKEQVHEDDASLLELDLEDEASATAAPIRVIAVFFSQKSYNPQILFQDMLSAWDPDELHAIDKINNYCFKLEFAREEDKI
jgi:hypothetical protein